ncbi:MAG: DUF1858 domain-containing protein [Hyphomonadaceae bacterium]|nr:DUF1858 domain-containing protein [Clostridia bacterium]
MKQLNMHKSIYDMTEQYPELIDFMVEMGYPQIRNNFLRKTMGKSFTLMQAIKQLNLNEEAIIGKLTACGFACVV